MTTLTLEKFLDDVKNHELTIRQNNGVDRHLIFKQSATGERHFNITTFQGYLIITGEMGSLVFSQQNDMFNLFRSDDLSIDPSYWGERIQSTSCEAKYASFLEFDIDKVKACAQKDLDDFIRDNELSEDDESVLRLKLETSVLSAEHEHEIIDRITNFGCYGFDFDEFWEKDYRTCRYNYIWLCYAIVWGIKKFDEVTKLKTKELAKEHALARERLKKKQKEEQAEMDKARELAWKDVQIACGHHKMNLTVGEICNDYGFFMQGWSYAIRYRTQE